MRAPQKERAGGRDGKRTAGGGFVKAVDAAATGGHARDMFGFAAVLIIIGIILALLGVFVEAVKFLLWLGIVLIVIGVIAALIRSIRRNA